MKHVKKCSRLRLKLFALLLTIPIIPVSAAFAQKPEKRGQTFVHINDNRQPIVDLTQRVKTNCTQSMIKSADGKSVEVRFQPEFIKQAENLANELMMMLSVTRELLSPLEVANIRFYLLQTDNIPINYQITDRWEGLQIYVHLLPFRQPGDISANACTNKSLCATLFGNIPHELTHLSVDHIVDRSARWFGEGLAEYVENSVEERYSPSTHRDELLAYNPPVSLHRKDIRETLFSWREPSMARVLKSDTRELRNDFYRYGASYELIRQTITTAERNRIQTPLFILLNQLAERRRKGRSPLTTEEIISIILESLNIDVRKIGVLDQSSQKALVIDALDILSRNDIDPADRNYALYALAGVESQLPGKWITYLLNQVYEYADELSCELAATALTVRMNHSNFDGVLKNYVGGSEKLKGKSANAIKRDLEGLSLRPRIK